MGATLIETSEPSRGVEHERHVCPALLEIDHQPPPARLDTAGNVEDHDPGAHLVARDVEHVTRHAVTRRTQKPIAARTAAAAEFGQWRRFAQGATNLHIKLAVDLAILGLSKQDVAETVGSPQRDHGAIDFGLGTIPGPGQLDHEDYVLSAYLVCGVVEADRSLQFRSLVGDGARAELADAGIVACGSRSRRTGRHREPNGNNRQAHDPGHVVSPLEAMIPAPLIIPLLCAFITDQAIRTPDFGVTAITEETDRADEKR